MEGGENCTSFSGKYSYYFELLKKKKPKKKQAGAENLNSTLYQPTNLQANQTETDLHFFRHIHPIVSNQKVIYYIFTCIKNATDLE